NHEEPVKASGAGPFDPSLLQADADGAADAVAKAGERGKELVEAWVVAKNAAAVAALAENEHAPAAARKAARRGVQVLKARGVAIPERARVAKIQGDSLEGHESWFVPPDAGGLCLVIVAARYRSGKHRFVQAFLREGVGLVELRSAEMSRAQLK